ncbi:retrotransposon protein, putative, ty1-copia subclass [Tanacetum coccineum]|uniref:Retrotransposon protein, putative, ty1-copia subclass n=1 Tax=Tanacetum coccineum TaxID=301880 RepID=A0ABQ4YAS9_9ASTR
MHYEEMREALKGPSTPIKTQPKFSAFKTFFERETLTGPNFNEWHRSLRIVLRVADTYEYLYKPCPDQPPETATAEERQHCKAEYKKHNDVAKPPAVEIYDLVDTLHSCKQAPGKSVSEHVLEMKGLMDQLHTLGKPYDNDMAVNLINRSLNKDFGDFVRNFNMHIAWEVQWVGITSQNRKETSKKKGKGKADKNKQVVPSQPKPNPKKRKENPNKDQACHHCHMTGHWKRNCPLYLEELRANKKKSEHSAGSFRRSSRLEEKESRLPFRCMHTICVHGLASEAAMEAGQYAVLIIQNTPYCLEEQIRCLDCRNQYVVLSGKVDTSYPTGGYGVSVDLSEQDT